MAREVRRIADFDRQFKRLNPKKRRGLAADFKDFVLNLESCHQQWKRVSGVEGAPPWTARMKDSSSGSGKSAGFRVYFFVTDSVIWLTHIQLRKEGDTVPARTLLRALNLAGLWPPSDT